MGLLINTQKKHIQTMSKATPVNNNVLIKPFPPEGISEGGIWVPDSFAEENDKAWVIAVGPGTKKRPMQFKEGMIVHRVHKWGTPIEIDGVMHYLMEDAALLAFEN